VPTDEHILIPFGTHVLALSLHEFQTALTKGQALIGGATPEPVPAGGEPLLDAEGAHQHTAIPASWFLEAARRGDIPHIRAGKYVRFRMADVLYALEVRPRHTAKRAVATKNGLQK